MTTTSIRSFQSSSTVVDFSSALNQASSRTPAGLTEELLPQITDSFWLLISSNALIDSTGQQVLRMVLRRAIPGGVSIALDVDWQPQSWGLPPETPPTDEVLRRLRPVAEVAHLIRCSTDEAEALFSSRDPSEIQRGLPQRPAVLVTDPAGVIRWSIGGRKGRLDPALGLYNDNFLAQMLANLCVNPQLLGAAGPGIDAIADPDKLAEQLIVAAAASEE